MLFLISLFRPFSPRNSDLYIRYLAPVALKILGIKVAVRNIQRFRPGQPTVFVTNHQSALDVFVIASLLPPGTLSVGKQSLKWIPFFGWLYWLSGHFLINRGDNAKAVATMQKALNRLKRDKLSMVIAPEGTRTTNLKPFKKGAFYLAVDAGLPIQPIAASSYEKYVDLGRLRAGTVVVKALEPIPTAGKTRDDIDEIVALAHERIRLGIEEVNRELANAAL